MNNIWEIFTENGLLEKKKGFLQNRSGIFYIPENTGPEILRLYTDITSRVGVELAGFALPLVSDCEKGALTIDFCSDIKEGSCRLMLADGGIRLCASTLADLQMGTEYLVCCYPKHGSKASDSAESVDIDRSWFDCSEGAEEGASSYDRAKKHFKQNLDVRVVVGEDAAEEPELLLAFALRMSLENYETVYPYGLAEPKRGCRNITFQKTEQCFVEKTPDGINVCGKGRGLYDLADAFMREEEYPFNLRLKEDLKEILSCKNEVGQVAEGIRLAEENISDFKEREKNLVTKNYTRALVDRERLQSFVSERAGETKIRNFNDEKEIIRKDYSMSWEGDDFMRIFREQVLPQIGKGDRVRIFGRLSEDEDVRRSLEKEMEKEVEECGAVCEAEIIRSFKSGLSWLEEIVLPGLLTSGNEEKVESVEIRFPYLLNERGDDTFENESTPNYGVHQDNPLKYFDIPTRWLQELFPADEILAEGLGISRDKIAFIRDDEIGHTYRIEFLDESGSSIFCDDFDVKYIQKPYIKKYPQIGKTHVTTGWICAEVNGNPVLEQRIETDTEKVWRILEEDMIPTLESYIESRWIKEDMPDAQPLFNRLQINIAMSEMDFDLGIRQERISTAEAMQEDLYFYLLDWFKTYGERECGRALDNVGLIMPEPEIRKGAATSVEMILCDDFAQGAELRTGSRSFSLSEEKIKLCTNRLSLEEGMLTLEMTCGSENAVKRAAVISDMFKEGILDFYELRPLRIRIQSGFQKCELEIPKRKPERLVLSEAEKNRMLSGEVIDYDQYMELLHYYEGKGNLRLFPVETTYKGRKIFAFECISRAEGTCYAGNKLKTEKISSVFTARHHGNESSSLNSTFMLTERLIGDMESSLEKVNVVLVPFINIDGGMLHCGVQRKHPKWLCHPARYNSAGFEFRKDFNNPDSKYGEAKLLGKLWKHYLFDVITDNHGFEGHELCQPFSGYISPWYKSFWIPRAFYYGYVWYQRDRKHMTEIGSRIRQAVVNRINQDKEIYGLNQEFADRFYKYAEKWFPDLFKVDKFQDVVFYWIDTTEKPREANYGIRNPEITAIDWTTELADETAQDEYMGLNAKGHHLSDLAVFEVMEDCPLAWDQAVRRSGSRRTRIRFRRHPLYAEE